MMIGADHGRHGVPDPRNFLDDMLDLTRGIQQVSTTQPPIFGRMLVEGGLLSIVHTHGSTASEIRETYGRLAHVAGFHILEDLANGAGRHGRGVI